jgi:glutamate-1-semialdehyde 2,1-aminomutase
MQLRTPIGIVAVLQARVGSTRLPGKVLKPILGRPMLALQIERVRRAQLVETLVVATSLDASDDPLVELCRTLDVEVFRGSLDDVLDRVYRAATPHAPAHLVRLTGDCPLADPGVIDAVIRAHLDTGSDYTSNTRPPTFPDGLDVEVARFSCIAQAWQAATLRSEREHVTPYLYNNPEKFRLHSVGAETDRSSLRWTVDEPPDFEFVARIYGALYPTTPNFSADDVFELLRREPSLSAINSGFRRNEGHERSIRADHLLEEQSTMKTNSRSQAMQERARRRIPGMSQLLSKRPDMFSLGVWPGYYRKAAGAEVWDLDGNRYIDMSIGGIGANVLGYADPDVDAAVRAAIADGSSSSLNCPEEIDLADLLCELHPWAEMARYTRAGGEATTVAVRIARAHTGRDKVAFCGYHGWHDWYLAANLGTENALGEHLIAGLSPAGVPRGLAGTALPFRYNKPEELAAIIREHRGALAAVIMEPIRNEPPQAGFLETVKEMAHKAGAVFIFDEISSGLRMNSGGAHLTFGVDPDVAVFSKALGNGYPIGAVIGTGTVMQSAQGTFISSTCWTERIGPVAAIATLRKHRALDLGKHLMTVGEKVQRGWQAAGAKTGLGVDVGGIYPLSHFVFTGQKPQEKKALFVQLLLDRGFLASTSFYAMGSHRQEHVTSYLAAVDDAFAAIARASDDGSLERQLRGKPASVGFKRIN